MRIFSRVMWMIFCLFAIPILSIVIGVNAGSVTAGFIAFGFLCFGFYLSDKAIHKAGRVDMRPWLESVKECKYSYAWDGCGIAVDPVKNLLHIAAPFNNKTVSKTYAFGDVREWGYEAPGHSNIMTFGNVGVSAATGVAAANAAGALRALDKTGLWVKVKDIDFPRWFIKFGGNPDLGKKVVGELDRWMEILGQNING